jgi:hypothetical protein
VYWGSPNTLKLNQPKTVILTDLSVDLTEKSIVLTDFIRCVKKLKIVGTKDKIKQKLDC